MWEEKLARYDALVDQCPQFDRKGKTVPYTSANGYMFSILNKDGELGIRFSKEAQQQYMQAWGSTVFKSHGATMRGYVLVPEALFADSDQLVACLIESYEYVMTLEPK